MRTVTFSNAEVVKQLGELFVCAWVNRRPDLKFRDDFYGPKWKPSGLPSGAGITNVTSVFASPDGTILHAIPGYLNPAGFKRHLAFARSLHLRLTDPELKSADVRTSVYTRAHSDAARLSKDRPDIAAHTMMAIRCQRVSDFRLTFFDELDEES